MARLKNWKIGFLGMFIALFGLLAGILILDEAIASESKIKVDKLYIEDFSEQEKGSLFLSPKKEKVSLGINQEELDRVYISPTLETKYTFNALGVKADVKKLPETKIKFYLKVKDEWQEVEIREIEGENNNYQIISEVPYAVEGKELQYKIILERLDKNIITPEIKNLEIFYLDTTEQSALDSNTLTSKNIKDRIITREEWGADETWRFWEPQYEEPQKIVLHHTAGGTGGDDPAATVRAIYFWHSQIMGWGDIGYNYLVDSQGNVYEGRYGGNKVIGAHVYNEVDRIDYNPGSIGIAVLGCYEDEKSGCAEVSEFSPTIKASLTDLLAYLSKKNKIKPKGQSYFINNKKYNIIGHKHLDYTLCPGNIIYQNLASIRRQTQRKYKALKEVYFAGQLSKHNFKEKYEPGEIQEITLKYENTGTRVWERDKAYLKVYNGTGKDSTKFAHKSWLDTFGKFYFKEKTVAPGETATFKFKVKSPTEAASYKLKFKLFINKAVIKQSRETIKLNVEQGVEQEPLDIE